jgi:hypothetical protein
MDAPISHKPQQPNAALCANTESVFSMGITSATYGVFMYLDGRFNTVPSNKLFIFNNNLDM